MRVIFMGTPQFAVPALSALVGQGYDIVAAYTRPPQPAGRRGLEVTRSPVHAAGTIRHPSVHAEEPAR
jgi:methionyl-tRNA formyltransferase